MKTVFTWLLLPIWGPLLLAGFAILFCRERLAARRNPGPRP